MNIGMCTCGSVACRYCNPNYYGQATPPTPCSDCLDKDHRIAELEGIIAEALKWCRIRRLRICSSLVVGHDDARALYRILSGEKVNLDEIDRAAGFGWEEE